MHEKDRIILERENEREREAGSVYVTLRKKEPERGAIERMKGTRATRIDNIYLFVKNWYSTL